MRFFKTHLSVIFPLIVLLFSFQISFYLKIIIASYEKTMNDDYNIIVVCKDELNENLLFEKIKSFKSAQIVSVDEILEKLKKDMSDSNINALKSSLPNFYSIKLKSFPSVNEMNKIKSILMDFNGVVRVETFAKTHDKIYKFLKFLEVVSYIFSGLIAILGLSLIYKQMRIWIFEHTQRIDIMSLFGASFWLKGGILYKMSFFDSLISSGAVMIGFLVILSLDKVKNICFELAITLPEINLFQNFLILFAISFVLTLIATNLIMFKILRR